MYYQKGKNLEHQKEHSVCYFWNYLQVWMIHITDFKFSNKWKMW